MLRNYLMTALRNLLRRRGHTAINIAGLTCGLVCCLLILQFITYEYSFDDFNKNASSIYRVTQTRVKNSGQPDIGALGGYAMGPALAQGVPEVVRFARLHPDYDNPVIASVAYPDKVFEEEHVYYADTGFLQMFSYPLVQGDKTQALSEPGTLLLSESAARKYFGADNPMGQLLNVNGWISGTFRVNGVFHDVPGNSHLQFDVLLSMVDLLTKSQYSDPQNGWTWSNFYTYVELRPDADRAAVEHKFTEILLQNRGESFQGRGIDAHLNAQPLRDVHLNDAIQAPRTVQGSYRTVYFFGVIALVTLIIALVNYVNLATARSLDRSREVGVRKVIGAQRGQLIFQFLMESALINVAALVLAIILAKAVRPLINNLADLQLTDWVWSNPWLWAGALTILLAATALAGLYPAFILSSFRPVTALKGKSGSISTRLRLRQGLVVLQFAASVGLLIGTAVVYTQLDYMRHLDLGIDIQQILTVPGPRVLEGEQQQADAVKTLMHELRQIPAVRQVASSSALPGQGFNWYSSNLRRETADPSTEVNGVLAWVDTSFASLYGLELIAGDGFEGISENTPEGEPRPVIVNETVIKAVGFDSPADALQQLLSMGSPNFRIVGVFRDFAWSSAHSYREAALFTPTPAGSQLSLRVSTEDLPQTITAIERVYKTLFPGNPFRYSFVDEKFAEQYRNDQRFATLFSTFAGLAILIACLGLLGLASFSARQRTKEIGIRKALGASVSGLVALLSREFVKLVLLANFLAWPLAWYMMNIWLQNFAYHIQIGWWVFAEAGVVALSIALFTVGWQAAKAAAMNPVEALRYE